MEIVLIAGGVSVALALLWGYRASQREATQDVADAQEPRDAYARELQALHQENDRLLSSIDRKGGGTR